eukprot:TRINITY_DN10639_c0_g1_i7.p1 TRINITY_DN10639_c0_g1~~TRINITY_DN10639_c0_g1_i7.p1  ORF type:complete len:510 (-),score=72.28 TRINITY_DN10639_c0_g1_i7:56-1585(-)
MDALVATGRAQKLQNLLRSCCQRLQSPRRVARFVAAPRQSANQVPSHSWEKPCCSAPPECPSGAKPLLGQTKPDEDGCTCCDWSCPETPELTPVLLPEVAEPKKRCPVCCGAPPQCLSGAKPLLGQTVPDEDGCTCCKYTCPEAEEEASSQEPELIKPEKNCPHCCGAPPDCADGATPLWGQTEPDEDGCTCCKYTCPETPEERGKKGLRERVMVPPEPLPQVECKHCCSAPPECPLGLQPLLGSTEPDEDGCTCCKWHCPMVEEPTEVIGLQAIEPVKICPPCCSAPPECPSGGEPLLGETEPDENGCTCCKYTCPEASPPIVTVQEPEVSNRRKICPHCCSAPPVCPSGGAPLLGSTEADEDGCSCCKWTCPEAPAPTPVLLPEVTERKKECPTCCSAPPECPAGAKPLLGRTEPDENGCTCCDWTCAEVENLRPAKILKELQAPQVLPDLEVVGVVNMKQLVKEPEAPQVQVLPQPKVVGAVHVDTVTINETGLKASSKSYVVMSP